MKSLPEYAKTLNEEPREELSWKSAFEVYYGRKFNHADRLSEFPVAQEWDQTGEEYERMVEPKPSDYTRRTKACKRLQQSVASASKKCADRMIKKGLRNNPHLFIMLAKMFLFDTSPQRKSLGGDACCMPKPLRETYRHASSLLSLIIQPEHQKYYRSGFQSMTSPAEHSTKRKKKRGKLLVTEIRENIARNT